MVNKAYLRQGVEQCITKIVADPLGKKGSEFTSALSHLLLEASNCKEETSGSPTLTDHGNAIDPYSAAHCASDTLRTVKFLRGVHENISAQRQRLSRTIQLLDAGSGPLAVTTLPLLLIHPDVQLQAVDLHEEAIENVLMLAELLGVQQRVRGQVANLLQYHCTTDPDIAVCECMSVGLLSEPQAHITAALVPQLRPDCVWLPEAIHLHSFLGMHGQNSRQHMQHILTLNRHVDDNVLAQGVQIDRKIPVRHEPTRLYVHAVVEVTSSQTLGMSESDITEPVPLLDLDSGPAMNISLNYPYGGSIEDVRLQF